MRQAIWQSTSLLVWLQAYGTFLAGLILLRKRAKALDFAHTRRVLVVRLDEIGDMVMFSPFLRALREHLPDAYITLVVKPGVRSLVENCPYVNKVLTFDQSGGRAKRFLTLPVRAYRFAAKHLQQDRYDLALLPRWDADYYYGAFIAFWSGAPVRVGYSEKVTPYKRVVNRGFDRLLTLALDDRELRHDVEHNMEMLRSLGGATENDQQEIWFHETDQFDADFLLCRQEIKPGQMLIGIGPSGGHSRLKQWPAENFAELGSRLAEKYQARILIVGGPGEERMGQELADRLGASAINVVGKTTLSQMAALLQRCRIYIGNDSGPTHVAAAAGIPVIAIFGSSCPHRFHPGEHSTILWHDLPCSPCRTMEHTLNRCQICIFDQPHCLTEITVAEVERAAAHSLLTPTRRLPMIASMDPMLLHEALAK